ncbi:hypothetical protein GOC83_04975 [Haloarcula rubripromontorii]|uniref:Uncharacterized protein n=1 Tax=Haloarcula rubripromontorii TaxID=1705562 RepID=A0A847U2P2_9EURY|nr:hypothetical protein [Haloarcula rubripromontorii]NLV05488.1 hypothetical protein [Haloarcula rubripromontorii]
MMKTKTLFSTVAIVLLIMSAGCSGLTGGSGPAEQTSTPEATPTATPEATPTATATPEATPEATETPTPEPVVTESDSDELTKAEKFEEFDENVRRLYRGSNRSKTLKGTRAFPENDTYHLRVEMRDTMNRTKTVDDRTNPLWKYYVIVEDYNDNDDSYPERDHTYIPDMFNVTFVTEDGEVFETYYVKYTWAWKYSTGDWSMRVLLGKYGSTVEEGPGYHDKWK